jgi:predicted DNA-binding transcriptional regulator YafY
MRASRLLSILILLQLRVRLTAQQLADEFEVSVRTIYRDIDSLSAAGVPVYADRGPGGGFQLLGGYRTQLTGLAGDEAEAMPLIGMPGPAAALGLGAAAQRAQGKLMVSMSAAQRDRAGRMSARFHVDPLDWYREEDMADHVPALVRAVLDQHPIAMTYKSWTATREHRVEPLGLVMKGGAWYLVALSKGNVRTYKAANILSLLVEDARFERPADFDLAASWEAQLVRFSAELRPMTAKVRASVEGRRRLAELGDFAAAAVRGASIEDADGLAELSLPIESIDQAALLLIGFGGEVEALDPPELRDRIATIGLAAAARHGRLGVASRA